jgi:hypothetical protein
MRTDVTPSSRYGVPHRWAEISPLSYHASLSWIVKSRPRDGPQ